MYNFVYDCGYEYPKESALFMFTDGNYSCDCNKSLFIIRNCDRNFKELACGNEIKLEKIEINYVSHNDDM